MHELRTTAAGVATSSRENGQRAGRGCPERADARRSLVTGGPQHGGGMANPAESRAPIPAPRDTTANVGSVRQIGGRDHQDEGEPCRQDRVASMGGLPSADAPTVRAEVPTSAGLPVSTGAVMELLEAQDFRCAMTGRQLTPQTAALDHIVPIRCGGEHVIENTQVLEKAVNRAKGSLTSAEFIGMCREVVDWTGRSHGGAGRDEP